MATPADEMADGPWWFNVVVLYDGNSDEFASFFQQRMIDLDRATGRAVHLSAVGSPSVMGKLYAQYRTPEKVAQDAVQVDGYQRLVATHGGEGGHRRWETDTLVEELGIGRDSLPCLAFLTSPRVCPPPTLRVNRAWLRSPELQDAFADALVRHLAESRILSLGISGETTTQELVGRIEPIIDGILREMELAVSELDSRAARGRSAEIKSFRLPPDVPWSELVLRFSTPSDLDVVVRSRRRVFHFSEMGFTDHRRKGYPTVQWETLHKFADGHGYLEWHLTNRGFYERRVRFLSKQLKEFFRKTDRPIQLESRNRCWKTRFIIHPER